MIKNLIKNLGMIGFILILVLSLQVVSYAALSYQTTYVSYPTGKSGIVVILVNPAIYSAIEPSLKQYVADLEAEGYYVILNRYYGGNPQDIKNYCSMFITSWPSIKGLVLVGDLPVVEFEFQNDHNMYGYARFPCDLFYMDLNGQWLDSNANGVYDTHNPGTGTLTPEIWVSRLTASPLTNMTEAAFLNNYFAKNHSYRLGKLPINKRALAYPDDPWASDGNCGLLNAYTNVVTVNDNAATVATDYKSRLKQNFEWIHVCVHSGPSGHEFLNNGSWGGGVYNSDIKTIDPTALFYNLFACSNCKYNYSDYMGGTYVFAKTYGLAAVGSTKAGSMHTTYNFYMTLGSGSRKNLGEAFKFWFSGFDLSVLNTKHWFYGMTLVGDGTLTLDPPIAKIGSISPSAVEKGKAVTFTGSGSIASGSIVGYSWRSSINGYLGGSATVSTSALSTGTHTIYFKVKDSKGRWSSEAQGTLVVAPVAAPSNLVASAYSRTQIGLSWKDNSSLETGSKIYMSLDNVTFNLAPGGTVGANVTSFGVSNLVSGKKYYFRVMAYNTTGMSSYSNVASATTLP